MCTTSIERAAACLIAGAAYAFAFVQPGAAWVALPALATLAWCCLHAASARRAAWAGFAWGVPAFAGGLAWLHHALHDLGGTSLAITLPVMAFIVVVLAGYIAGVAWLAARVGTTPAQRALVFAPAWLAAEYARSHVFIGFPWMLAGDSQLDLPLGVLAPWAGVYGTGFALVAFAALLAWLLRGRGSNVTCVVVLAGIAAMAFEPAPPQAHDTWRVTALRIPAERMHQDPWSWYRERTFAMHGERDLIAWPEHVAPVHAHALRDDIEALAQHAAARGWALAFGLPVQESDGNTFNTMLAVGQGFGRYDKRELVPFVEHTPYRLLIGRTLSLIENKIAGFTPGALREAMVVGNRTVAAAICYEAAFPELVRDNLRAAGTPALMLMPSSDRWYGDGAGAHQMQRMARMRARENGIAVVRIASEGTSLFIDRAGRVAATLGAEGDGTLERAVAIDHTPTLWRRAGMAPIVVVAVLFLLVVCALRRRRGLASRI